MRYVMAGSGSGDGVSHALSSNGGQSKYVTYYLAKTEKSSIMMLQGHQVLKLKH
jgi:hypothetical protein